MYTDYCSVVGCSKGEAVRAHIARPEDLGVIVQRVRESHAMTQRQLAAALGTSQRYISELETGKPKRADARFFEILGKLGISITAEAPDE